MKKIKIFSFLAVLSALVLLTGCKKDMVTRMNSIPITFERFNGDGKAYIDDIYACWEDGDEIKITRTDIAHYSGTISISYPSGVPVASATASGFETATGDSVYVAYPRDLFGAGTVFHVAHDMQMMLPSIYEYVTTNGKQKIVSPMVGRLKIVDYESGEENPNVLKLTSLCCMLKIQLNKPSEGAFVLDSIKVVNITKTTPMSGYARISFGSTGTPELSMGGSTSDNTVVLDLKDNAVAINETKYFYVPIPPQASGQNFEVKIHNKLTGHWKTVQIYTNRSIPGNSVALITGPSTNDATPYTFYDWLYNYVAGSTSVIDLAVPVSTDTKTEITFIPMNGLDQNQAYTGSRYGGANTKTYYSITGFSHGYDSSDPFAAQFMDKSIVTNGGNVTNANFTTTTWMKRQAGIKYRHSFEVMEDVDMVGYYYGNATFEQLTGLSDQAGSNHAIITGRTQSVLWDNESLNHNITVFAFGGTYNYGMKLYGYRFWQGGIMTHNFVPAKRNEDGRIGVYDMSTETFIPAENEESTLNGDYYQTTHFRIGND